MPEEKQPQSGAPNFNELELKILKFWEENKIFEKSLEQTKDGQPYIFYDGPPFATGLPHYGSILPSVIKDAIPRYQTMKGRFVRRRWGWDCHGLPIENIVEQHLKISGKKQIEEVGVARFNEVCRDNVLKYVAEWGKTINRIARWVEFENSYKTMDTSYMESVWWGLKQIWEKGLIYEDRKVLLYCSRCETPISNFEVAMDNSYREVTEQSVYAKFKMLKGQRIVNDLTNDKTFALAWTTTPWTIPGNTSLNVGPDITYVIIDMESKERYILAKDRLSIIEQPYEVVAEFPGRAMEGLRYERLFAVDVLDPNDRAYRVYPDSFVTTTDGTGIVSNAPMYGEIDYQLAKEKGIPGINILDHQGKYLPAVPDNLQGLFFKDGDKVVLKDLQANGLLYKIENYLHSYPHCYRCGTPLFYNALPAWFINIQKVKADLLKNNEDINWYPEHLKHGRFSQGVQNAPDWNISRNRYWATPLPFWKCENKECRNVVCVESINDLKEKAINFGEVYPNFQADIKDLNQIDLHKPYIDSVKIKCEKCDTGMSRVPEVVDCWVESGSMPFAELHYPFEHNQQTAVSSKQAADLEDFQKRFPADFVVEYIPQTRAWFYVMHVVSTILFGRAPFKNVVTTGTILAEDGSKMSKSKNNYPDPNLVIEKYGADALRFYLLSSPVVTGEDLNFSEKGVQEVSRKINLLLYNVWSFLRMYTKEKFAGSAPDSENILDRWIIARLNLLKVSVTENLDAYDTVRSGKAITEFINELSTWYVRRSRDRMKESGADSKVALGVLAAVLSELSKLLAPFMPFLAEFIFCDITGKESVHLQAWPSGPSQPDDKLLKEMALVREIVSLGLAGRKNSSLAVRQPLRALAYSLRLGDVTISPQAEQLIKEELNIKVVDATLLDKDTRPENVIVVPGAGNISAVYLDIELTEELKREGLARELERLVQDLRKKSGLKVGDLVDMYYNTADEKLEDILLTLFDRKKTFVSQVSKSLEVEADFETQGEVDAKTVWIGLVKI